MKKIKYVLLGMLMLVLCAEPIQAAEMQSTEVQSTETADVYSMTVTFNANKGKGAMTDLTVSSDKQTMLTKNAFTRSGFQFNGWNTKPDGSGISYANGANVTNLVSTETNGTKVVLYAKWKLKKPSISKLKMSTPVNLKVSYKKDKKASGYEIQYATNTKFKKAKTVTAKKGTSSCEIKSAPTGKTCYVRMRSYEKVGKKKIPSDWSKTKKIKIAKVPTIENTKSEVTIEADVMLKGSGTGYHAKLVMCTPTAAVSYGLQYDACAVAPYTGKTMAMIENVASNAAGGQTYTRYNEVKRNKWYHLMMTVDKKGRGAVYLDYKKVGSFTNSNLANQLVYMRVEGAGRLNGDGVDATFKNIKCKTAGKYDPNRVWTTSSFDTNKGLKSKVKKDGTITVKGRIKGLPGGGDWDNCYESVSGIRQFIQ